MRLFICLGTTLLLPVWSSAGTESEVADGVCTGATCANVSTRSLSLLQRAKLTTSTILHASEKEPDQSSGIWTAEESKLYWGDRNTSNAEDTACPCIKEALREEMTRRGYKSAADFGAGMGGYALYLKRMGVEEVHCYDGNEVIVKSSGGLCQALDLSQLQKDVPTVDMVYSLEVGEHIPKEFEANFLDNLSNAAKKGVFLSWAAPLQGGTGHFNEQPKEYIISAMEKRGFAFDNATSVQIRKNARECLDFWWFSRNVIVFVKT